MKIFFISLLLVSFAANFSFAAELENDKIWRIRIQNSQYKTSLQLDIGSTLAQIKQHLKVKLLEGAEANSVSTAQSLNIFCSLQGCLFRFDA